MKEVVQPTEESIGEKLRSISVTSTGSQESSQCPISRFSSTSSFGSQNSYPISESSLGGSSGTCLCAKGQVVSIEGVEGNRDGDSKLPPLTEENPPEDSFNCGGTPIVCITRDTMG